MAKQAIVTLLTDFGVSGPYVAAMKGVILSVCPRAQIVDISHEVAPQDVLAGAMVLAQAAPCFPPGTLHVAVIDPAVGTERRLLAAVLDRQTFLLPDNGLITFVAQRMPMAAIVAVRNRKYLPHGGANTFDGRDVFAPLAGQILNGLDINRLGPQPSAYKLLDLPDIQLSADRIVGQVIYVDHFGNLVSNIPEPVVRQRIQDPDGVRVRCNGKEAVPFRGTYGFVEPGESLALFNSMGYVELAVNYGRANEAMDAGVGSEVEVILQ